MAWLPPLLHGTAVLEQRSLEIDERAICRKYADRIRSYGLCHLRDTAAAQDLVQQVLLGVLEALRDGRVEQPERLGAYVLGACRNTVMDMRRGDARRRRVAEQASVGLPEDYEPSWATVDRLRLEQCLRELEPRDRSVVLATFLEDRGADEIGQKMNLTAGNVRVIRHRALAQLRSCLDGAEA
jgi:RNA polymerase sigma-70 factor, ECF subfamily